MSVDHARQLHKQGYHTQASEEIQSIRSTAGDTVELVTFLAEIYVTQGYLNRAHSLITVDVQNVKDGDDHTRWALEMMGCFTGAIVSGKIWASFPEANRIYNDAAVFLKADPTAYHAVRSSSNAFSARANPSMQAHDQAFLLQVCCIVRHL
jgi:hypothetical protein